MITTEVKGYKTSERFPMLRMLKSTTTDNPGRGTIVLFTDDTTGTVVHSIFGGMSLGFYADDWTAGNFEDFCGELTLKQE